MTQMTKNIVILLLDTVRASDVYGNNSLKALGSIARNGTAYTHAVAPGTWTAPTHASLFTNRKVSEIRQVSRDFLKNGTYKIDPWMVKTKFLAPNAETMAQKLSAYGYESTLLSNNPFVTSFTNLAMGFNSIHDVWKESNVKYNKSLADRLGVIINNGAGARAAMMNASYYLTRFLPKSVMDHLYLHLRQKLNEGISKAEGTHMLDRGARSTNKLLKDYLTYRYNYKPQFIFINYMEAHENYPVGRKNVVQDKWLYLSGIEQMDGYAMNALHDGYLKRLEYLDREVGSAMGILKKRGLLDDATVVIASDHGQSFGGHGMLYHSLPPYDDISRVPLIAANFKNSKMVKMRDTVETPVSISTLHKSMLDLASGRFDYLDGNLKKSRYVVSEHTGISEGWDEKLLRMLAPRSRSAAKILKAKKEHNIKVTAVYRDNMKLMHYFGKRKDELYDLECDPSESINIIDNNRGTAMAMVRSLAN